MLHVTPNSFRRACGYDDSRLAALAKHRDDPVPVTAIRHDASGIAGLFKCAIEPSARLSCLTACDFVDVALRGISLDPAITGAAAFARAAVTSFPQKTTPAAAERMLAEIKRMKAAVNAIMYRDRYLVSDDGPWCYRTEDGHAARVVSDLLEHLHRIPKLAAFHVENAIRIEYGNRHQSYFTYLVHQHLFPAAQAPRAA